jgi:DNA-binding transcriptional ArsR family regulator
MERGPRQSSYPSRNLCKTLFAKIPLQSYDREVANRESAPETGTNSHPPDFPEWIDPSRDLILTPSKLKGISHPIRLRLLDLLQQEGPATATSLAAKIGQSSGVTSYHLRVLAENGLIEEDTERGNARDRFWKAPHRSISFSVRLAEDPGTEEKIDATSQYLRIVADEVHRRMLVGIDLFTAGPESMASAPWKMNDWAMRLTPEEARELSAQISDLAHRYFRPPGDPDPRPGTVRAYFGFQLLPDEPTDPT